MDGWFQLGRLADLLLAQARLQEGSAHPQLIRGLLAGTVIAAVVRVRAVDESGKALFFCRAQELGEYGALAMVAAVRRIRGDGGVGKHGQAYEDLGDAENASYLG
jgi:hypothetical protein